MPPAPPPPDPLLDAALRVLARGEALTVRAVAAEAGVARGTVYRRYADRDALLTALRASGRAAPGAGAEPRERLLDAVGVLLRRQGLAATTLEAVAAEAGVGVATVYRRFGDRRGLLQAFMAERTPRRLLPELRASDPPEVQLLALTRASLQFLRTWPELVTLAVSPDPESAALLAELRDGSASVRARTAALLATLAPDPHGRVFVAYGGMLTAIAVATTGDLDEDARFVVRTLLGGAAAAVPGAPPVPPEPP